MNQPNELFRKEAIAYRLSRSRTEQQLPMTARLSLMIWVLLGLLFVLLALMFTVKYRETESARGRLTASGAEQQLVSPQSGVLDEMLVASGDKVVAGQVLARILTGLHGADGEPLVIGERLYLEEKLGGLQEQKQLLGERHSLLVENLQARISEQQTFIELAKSQRDALANQHNISNELLAATRSLLENASISEARFKQQELEHLRLVQSLAQADEKLHQSTIRLQELQDQIATSEVEQSLSDAKLDQEITALVQELDANHNSEHVAIIAARDGYVSTIAVKEGESVSQRETILYLQANEQAIVAEVFVPSSVVARLHEGQETLLRYDAFDFHTYGRYVGTIEHIGRSPLDPREHLLPIPVQGEPLFPVRVKPQLDYVEGPEVYPLQTGLLLEADFITSELSLIEFMFKPVLNLRGKIL